MKTLWILEDHASLRRALQTLFAKEPEAFQTRAFGNATALLSALETETRLDIVLIDIGLPDANGLDVIPKIRSRFPLAAVIVLTVSEDDEKIFRAVCEGASGYLLKASSAALILKTVKEALSGGAPMSPSVARRVLELFSKATPKPKEYGLSPREQEILQCIVRGLTTKEIAGSTGLSSHTVDSHLRKIYSKLQVNSRPSAVAKATKERIVL